MPGSSGGCPALPYQFDRFAADCRDRVKASDAVLAEGRTALDELCQQLRAARLSAEPMSMPFSATTVAAFDDAHRRAAATVREALAAKLTKEQLGAFDQAVQERRYADAVAELPRATTILGATGTGAAPSPPRLTTEGRPGTRPLAAHSDLPAVDGLSADQFLARARQNKQRAEFVQTIVAGVLIVGVGYALFADKFVGTLADVATLLLWGFTVDISVAKLTELTVPWISKVQPS